MNRYTLLLTSLLSLVSFSTMGLENKSKCDPTSFFSDKKQSSSHLIKRNGLYYERFSDVPYSGEIVGLEQGCITKGKKEGEWSYYHFNGQLNSKGYYHDQEKNGEWIWYNEDGTLNSDLSGIYLNGKKISD